MYSRSFIRENDKTTTGGEIQARFNGVTAGTPPLNICFEGDPVACPACKSIGITKCIAPYRPSTGHDGRQVNLDGDLCICKCFPAPRLTASFHNDFMGFERHEVAAMPDSAVWLDYNGHVNEIQSKTRHGKIFEFRDSETGKPLAHRTFIARSGGAIHKSKTDVEGRAIVEAPAGQPIEIHLVFDTPVGEMNCDA